MKMDLKVIELVTFLFLIIFLNFDSKRFENSPIIIAIIEFKFNEGENGTHLKDF